MRTLSTIALLLAAPLAAAGPLHLQALVPTSGSGAAAVLDGDVETGWSPAGDPGGEGLLLRFEQPEPVSGIRVRLCPGSGGFNLLPYVNGTAVEASAQDRDREVYAIAGAKLRSLFLRVAVADGVPCVGEVEFLRAGERLAVAPPRRRAGAVAASSTLRPVDAYHPAYLFDGRTDFGWVEGARGLGRGESIRLTLDEPLAVEALEIWNGYQRSKDHFYKNARAVELGLRIDGGEQRTLKLADKMGPQKIALDEPVRGKVFELTIRKARRGSRYPDLVLSELRLWDAAGPLSVVTDDMQQRRQALLEQIAGGPLEQVVDRQYACACCVQRSTRLKLRSNHTFVWYEDDQTADGESRSEVFDGAWVMAKSKPPAALIKLYGRRHRTAAKFDPYAGNEVESSVRIGGGKLQLVRLADIDPAQFATLVKRWQRGPARDRVACLGLPEQDLAAVLERLVVREAILVRGRAITDLLVHVTR